MPTENISKTEKLLSLSIGGRLLIYGLDNVKRKPVPSIIKMLLGGFLMYRGYSGYCPANDSLGLNTANQSLGEAIDTYTNTNPIPITNTYIPESTTITGL